MIRKISRTLSVITNKSITKTFSPITNKSITKTLSAITNKSITGDQFIADKAITDKSIN